MSDISNIDRIKLERLFDMNAGYVLDFSNRTFSDFCYESIGVDIYTPEYADGGDSKANRLRTLWRKGSNSLVSKLLLDLLEYYKELVIPQIGWSDDRYELYTLGLNVAQRLQGNIVEHIEAITVVSDDKDFETVGKSIRKLIHDDKPEEAIDRLHTYLTMFVRHLCVEHKIQFDNNKPTHSLFGEYIKVISQKGFLESVMAERILKSSISIVDAFNDVRNNQSLAHANKLLGYDESLLIFRTVTGIIAFINSVEQKITKGKKALPIDDLPF
jgi:hypothetical protein